VLILPSYVFSLSMSITRDLHFRIGYSQRLVTVIIRVGSLGLISTARVLDNQNHTAIPTWGVEISRRESTIRPSVKENFTVFLS
jgi:hypothetical protein